MRKLQERYMAIIHIVEFTIYLELWNTSREYSTVILVLPLDHQKLFYESKWYVSVHSDGASRNHEISTQMISTRHY